MNPLIVTAAVVLTTPGLADPADRIRALIDTDDTSVWWVAPRSLPADSVLEVGEGYGHSGDLDWLRFRPGRDGVEVLAVRTDEGRKPFRSKWPPDRAAVTVRVARMPPADYAALLRDVAVTDSARPEPAWDVGGWRSTANFWARVHVEAGGKVLVDHDWAGYMRGRDEAAYVRPRVAAQLARDWTAELTFKDHTLTAADRAWASAKFARDWERYADRSSYWWVRERYLITVGVVGDAAALPKLRRILAAEPPPDSITDRRCTYHAINAVTRLTGKDVRPRPVEEMDLDATRKKVLAALPPERK